MAGWLARCGYLDDILSISSSIVWDSSKVMKSKLLQTKSYARPGCGELSRLRSSPPALLFQTIVISHRRQDDNEIVGMLSAQDRVWRCFMKRKTEVNCRGAESFLLLHSSSV